MRRDRPVLTVLLWILLSFITLFPIYWLFVISVKPAVDLFSTPSVILDGFYWKNYAKVLGDETLRRYMTNSLIISSGNALLSTTLAFMACYALSRFDIAGKENIFFWTITNRMAPAAVFLLPFFLLFTKVFVIGELQALRHPHRADPALLHLQPAVRDLDAQADHRGHPQGARRGRHSRWRLDLAGDPRGGLPAGAAGPRRDADPDLGLRLERVPARGDADQLQRAHASPPACRNMSPRPAPNGARWRRSRSSR